MTLTSDSDEDDVLPKLEKKTNVPNTPQTPAITTVTAVAKPVSTSRASRAREQFQDSTVSITSYLKDKVGLDEKKHQLEEMKIKMLQEKEQVSRAKDLLNDPFLSDDMRTELQQFIFSTVVRK